VRQIPSNPYGEPDKGIQEPAQRMTITPEDVDEICRRVVQNTMAKVLKDDRPLDYDMGIKFGLLQIKLIDNLISSFKAKMQLLPGPANDLTQVHGDIPNTREINPLDRFGIPPAQLIEGAMQNSFPEDDKL
jgi:hypothetical protein